MKEKLLQAIEQYCAQYGITETTASNYLMGSGSWVKGLRNGRSITLDTYDKVAALLREKNIVI